MSRRVIVTRPARDAQRWVGEMRAAGLDAHALPLIGIEPVEDDAARTALREARQAAGSHDAAMFVSAAAVDHFFAVPVPGASDADTAAAGPQRCWATGPGTVRALRRAGVPDARIDAPPDDTASFDSEALWIRVRDRVGAGTRVLIVRGGDAWARPTGRDWLARAIEEAGGRVDTVVAYRRLAPRLDAADRALALSGAADGSVWLFSSSEAIAHLRQALPDVDWRGARAVATHERIAQAAEAAGFGAVRRASPRLAEVVASIESFG